MKSKSGPKPKRRKTEVIEVQDGKINPPVFLSKDAKEVWKQYADTLIAAGSLTPLSVPVFTCFCDQMSLIKKCRASIEKRGLFNTNGYGTQQVAPEVRIMNTATEIMLKCAKELGMTPKSRGAKVQFRVTPTARLSTSETSAAERRARLFKVVE
jgi:P27 family predicted phage terminase small subunit